MNHLDDYSKIIADPKLLEQNWQSFVEKNMREKIGIFSPINIIKNSKIKNLLKKLKCDRYFDNKQQYISMLNHIRCDSHADLTLDILKKHIDEK